jgi:hypothetical protein
MFVEETQEQDIQTFNVRIPRALVEWLDKQAAQDMRSRNSHLVWMLSQTKAQQEAERKPKQPKTKRERIAA